ncbi:uncharacterized protein LOC118510031 [Anopheles stephensi]|uniref:uncharacterized protein LOC118510031 n=1 Tax=Anopheles stephensi TaxID=30069 RepID=UPI0016588BE6|nr:uncharacterized protein LOC118510031 [Anopheles stephensi]
MHSKFAELSPQYICCERAGNHKSAMTGCDHLVEIPTADWTELRQLFQCDWPKHEFAYYLLGNYETWKGHHETLDVKCYSLNGNWRIDGSFLLKDGFEIYFYSKADDNSWTVLVQLLSLIGWDAFNEISMDYLEKFHPAVERIISDKCLTVSSSKCANYYFLPKEQALTLHSSTIPKGFTLSRLQLKDLDTIYVEWPLRNHISYEAGYGLLKRLILLNENVGLFDETGVLVSWCLSDQTGAHSDLQTTAACCRRGYGRMVVEELARRLARSGSDSKAFRYCIRQLFIDGAPTRCGDRQSFEDDIKEVFRYQSVAHQWYTRQVTAAPGIPGGLVSRQVNYTGIYNITAIRAYDRTFNRTGQAHITGGGLYQRFVNLALQTRFIGNPLDFLLCQNMPSVTNLQRIAWEELPELLDLYRAEWPRYAYTFYTLENGYRWRELAPDGELEVFTDPERDWRTTGTFVLRDCKELFFFTLEATFESLEKVLRAVMSRMGTSVSLVYDCCFRDVVDRTIAILSLAKSSDERMVCYRQLAPCDDGKDPHGELQQGYRFSAVKPEDSAVVEAHWVHNDPIFTNLPTRLIKRNPSLGVYDRHDRLVAWCLIDQTGALAIFQTIPDHRRKGLGRALIKQLSGQLHERSQLPQAFIVESNVASRSLFEQLGFNAVELWYWTKVHRQES